MLMLYSSGHASLKVKVRCGAKAPRTFMRLRWGKDGRAMVGGTSVGGRGGATSAAAVGPQLTVLTVLPGTAIY